MSFETLNVKPEIINALRDEGIEIPTEIQEQVIPLIQSGRDVIGISKTGSGKTAAFGIPVLEEIRPNQGIQAIFIAPTRELAVQISQHLRKIGKYLPVSIATVYGGVSLQPQIERLSRADIVVGTPGRILDHLGRRTLDLSRIRVVVLDEADKMAEMGFVEDIEEIIGYTPSNRQMLLFGATLCNKIDRLKQQYMRDPATAETQLQVEEEYLQQYYYDVSRDQKFSLLVHLLNTEKIRQAIVFCSTIVTVELIYQNLQMHRIKAEMIHGKLGQSRRLRVIDQFNKGEEKILVASPVAARGLDIKDVTHIFNYDLAQDPEEYIHRIGRTARAGESGKAITLLSQRDYETFSDIQNRYQLDVQELLTGDFPMLHFHIPPRRRSSAGRGDYNPRWGPQQSQRSQLPPQRRRFDGPRASRRGSSGQRSAWQDSHKSHSNSRARAHW